MENSSLCLLLYLPTMYFHSVVYTFSVDCPEHKGSKLLRSACTVYRVCSLHRVMSHKRGVFIACCKNFTSCRYVRQLYASSVIWPVRTKRLAVSCRCRWIIWDVTHCLSVNTYRRVAGSLGLYLQGQAVPVSTLNMKEQRSFETSVSTGRFESHVTQMEHYACVNITHISRNPVRSTLQRKLQNRL